MQRCCLVTCVEDTDVTNCDPMSFKNEDHRAELSMFSLVVPGLLSLVGSHGINTNLGIIPMSAMILVSHDSVALSALHAHVVRLCNVAADRFMRYTSTFAISLL